MFGVTSSVEIRDNGLNLIVPLGAEDHLPQAGDCVEYQGKEYNVLGRRFILDPSATIIQVFVKGGWTLWPKTK